MTPQRLEELRERARKLESDHTWLAHEFGYFAEQATDVATARDLMKWLPLSVWFALTNAGTDKQSRLGPLSLACKVSSLRRGDACGSGGEVRLRLVVPEKTSNGAIYEP